MITPKQNWCANCKAEMTEFRGACLECRHRLQLRPITIVELIAQLREVHNQVTDETFVSINGCDCAELAGHVTVVRGTASHGDVVKILRIDDQIEECA